jgi:hypothetical protein
MDPNLDARSNGEGKVIPTGNGWRLEIPAGDKLGYRLAQVDNYARRGRKNFPHGFPLEIRLRARVSAQTIPGTWGLGLWNDPFGLSFGFGGRKKQLPALPQVAWFMHASQPNWLELQDGSSPANGFFAGSIESRKLASGWFVPGIPFLPLFTLRPFSRLVRRLASRFLIQQSGSCVDVDVTGWHEFSIRWLEQECRFSVDGMEILKTSISPLPPLGLVIWIDNQFAAWTPSGRIAYGTLDNQHAWMEVEAVQVLAI